MIFSEYFSAFALSLLLVSVSQIGLITAKNAVTDGKFVVKVINLDKRKDKWNNIKQLWSDHFQLERVSAVVHSRDPVCGLALTHIGLMREFLKDKSQDFLLIMEDDAHPTPDFNVTFFRGVMEHAMRIPFWQVINFGPWFSRQPIVEPVDEYLVAIDYFHTTHFMGYHRRVLERYLTTYANVIEQGYCLAVDNYFGNYGTAKSQSLILAASRIMAIQNHNGLSDIGGGPQMDACAINAALAGRLVRVDIVSAPRADIRPTFKKPVYGYKVRQSTGGALAGTGTESEPRRLVWSEQCNLDGDEVDERDIEEVRGSGEDREQTMETDNFISTDSTWSSPSTTAAKAKTSGNKSKSKKKGGKSPKKNSSSNKRQKAGSASNSNTHVGEEELL